MFQVFNYRLYPTASQRVRLESTLETCRRFYNDCLGERMAAYETDKRTVGKVEQLRRVKVHKASNPFATRVPSHVLQVVVADLDKAMQAFFRRIKTGEVPGYPRFKGKNRFHSFGYKEANHSFKIDSRRLRLSGIGRIAVRWHRRIEGKVKTLRIVCKNGKWYASFCCEVESVPLTPTTLSIGLDVGINALVADSDGGIEPNPQPFRVSAKRLAKAQKKLARCRKGSHRRQKAIRRVARIHEHVAAQRRDNLHKISRRYVAKYQRIVVEDLSITGMLKNHCLALSISDAGWGMLRQMLAYKAANAGREFIAVPPHYTSQKCNRCGNIVWKSLSVRTHVCLSCGYIEDRDINAAKNILDAGNALAGYVLGENYAAASEEAGSSARTEPSLRVGEGPSQDGESPGPLKRETAMLRHVRSVTF